MIGAMNVVQSVHAVRRAPARKHKQRRGQSAAYHRRIQKKWTKRHGLKSVPCAYVIDNGALAMFAAGTKQTLVIHPSLMPLLRSGNFNLDNIKDFPK